MQTAIGSVQSAKSIVSNYPFAQTLEKKRESPLLLCN